MHLCRAATSNASLAAKDKKVLARANARARRDPDEIHG